MPPVTRQFGMTLIETTCALALSAVLLTGVASLTGWLGKQQVQQEDHRYQLNHRQLARVLEQDITRAERWLAAPDGLLLLTWVDVPHTDEHTQYPDSIRKPAFVGYCIKSMDGDHILVRWAFPANQRNNQPVQWAIAVFDVVSFEVMPIPPGPRKYHTTALGDTPGSQSEITASPQLIAMLQHPRPSASEIMRLLEKKRRPEGVLQTTLTHEDQSTTHWRLTLP